MANPINTLPKDVLIYTLALAGQPAITAQVSKQCNQATQESFAYLRKAYETTEILKDYCKDVANLPDVKAVKEVYIKILGECMGVGKKPSPWDISGLLKARKDSDLLKIVNSIRVIYPQIPAYSGPRSGKELEEQVGQWLNNNANAVIALDMSSLKLRFLFPLIGKLINLKTLWLDGNQLQSIPKELGNLTHLKNLYLSNNQLQNIPSELGNLISLETLGVINNQLQSIPSELRNLTNLKKLWVDAHVTIPTEVLNLPGLIIFRSFPDKE